MEIPELKVRCALPLNEGRGSATIAVSALQLWAPEHPRLYEVRAAFGEDRISDRIGFREIRVEGDRVLLNGRSRFLRGISVHEESPLHGRTLSEPEMLATIGIAKELNCNFIRLAHYPHSGRMAELADREGLLLWEEIPVYWSIDFASESAYRSAENQLGELIARDVNRASVILWSVGNETPDTDVRLRFMRSLVKRARQLDPIRLVTAACLYDLQSARINDRLVEALDVVGVNEYFGWYDRDPERFRRLFAQP